MTANPPPLDDEIRRLDEIAARHGRTRREQPRAMLDRADGRDTRRREKEAT